MRLMYIDASFTDELEVVLNWKIMKCIITIWLLLVLWTVRFVSSRTDLHGHMTDGQPQFLQSARSYYLVVYGVI